MTNAKQYTKPSRHKWIKDDNGKRCEKCGSRVNDRFGAIYIEVDKWGLAEEVNWYPRCFPKSETFILTTP